MTGGGAVTSSWWAGTFFISAAVAGRITDGAQPCFGFETTAVPCFSDDPVGRATVIRRAFAD